MSVDHRLSSIARAASRAAILIVLGACAWFTDFKEQPKIDPWDTPADTIPPRSNPQGSIPITGSSAPRFMYAGGSRDIATSLAALAAMTNLPNPVAADSASVSRGRILYQINCAICHGAAGESNRAIQAYGIVATQLSSPTASSRQYSDGYIYGIIRNGRTTMPSYARLEDRERWDVVNYVRLLQGKLPFAIDTTRGRPGETGVHVPGASLTAPTRPAPYYRAPGALPPRTDPSSQTTPPPAAAHGAGAAGHAPPDTTKGVEP